MAKPFRHKVLNLLYSPMFLGLLGVTAIVLLLLQAFYFEAGNKTVLLTITGLVIVGWILQTLRHGAHHRFQKNLVCHLENIGKKHDCGDFVAEAGLAYTYCVADNFNQIHHSLLKMQEMISDVTRHLSEQSALVSDSASFIATQLPEQITNNNEVVALVERMQSAFSNTIDMAQRTVEITQKSENEGNSGKLVMTDAMGGIAALSESVTATGQLVEQLGQESEEINGIINVIKGVAEQTNLLALNAAIEAARAGEQGRGFAVVADEVRTLAGKTQQHAAEIEAIIDRLVANVRETSRNVSEAVKLADSSDQAIEGVVVSYSEIVGYMVEISNLSNSLAQVTQSEKQSADVVFNKLQHIKEISENSEQRIDMLRHSGIELESLGKQLDVISSQHNRRHHNPDDEDDVVELF